MKNSMTGRRITSYSYDRLIKGETICQGIDADGKLAYYDIIECIKVQDKTTKEKREDTSKLK